MDKNQRSQSGLPGALLQRVLWLLLIAVVLYVTLAVVPDLVTARLYDLVWATMDQ